MIRSIQHQCLTLLVILCALVPPALAQNQKNIHDCTAEDRPCLLKYLHSVAKNIDRDAWRDQTLRELAKSYTADRMIDNAIAVIDEIKNPDTKAMTIRGIGMELADLNLSKKEQDAVFKRLTDESHKITHPPSFAIALTYVAMGQAFARDNEGAWATAASMENDALRHKAYGETAEIQAERGNLDAALKSISFIETDSYRNKSYSLVSKILADQNMFAEALVAANGGTNAYKKAASILYILNKEKEMQRETAQKP